MCSRMSGTHPDEAALLETHEYRAMLRTNVLMVKGVRTEYEFNSRTT